MTSSPFPAAAGKGRADGAGMGLFSNTAHPASPLGRTAARPYRRTESQFRGRGLALRLFFWRIASIFHQAYSKHQFTLPCGGGEESRRRQARGGDLPSALVERTEFYGQY